MSGLLKRLNSSIHSWQRRKSFSNISTQWLDRRVQRLSKSSFSNSDFQLLPRHGALQKEMKAVTAQAESCCVYVKPPKIRHHMHGKIPQLFDCWAHPLAHLLLLKSSMTYVPTGPPYHVNKNCIVNLYSARFKKQSVILYYKVTNWTWEKIFNIMCEMNVECKFKLSFNVKLNLDLVL